MPAEVKEQIGEVRGVNVRWVDVIVAGHTVEQVLSFDIAEAEAVHGRPFDDELDKHLQMGIFTADRISADGTMHKVASARSYVLDGKCIRTAKIEHCREIEPMSAGWRITRADGTEVPSEPWSCVPGTEPISHSDLPPDDEVSRFLRGVAERTIHDLADASLRPNRESKSAGSLGYGYRHYNLWYSRAPWNEWDMSYRLNLRRDDEDNLDTGIPEWRVSVSFTYLKDENRGLERLLDGLIIHGDQTIRTDQVEVEHDQIIEYGVIEVAHRCAALSETFASTLARTLATFIGVITPVVGNFETEHER